MPGTVRLWRQGWRGVRAAGASIVIAGSAEPQAMTALTVNTALQGVRRPARHHRRRSQRRARRAAADHRPERRRQDHAVQPDHRRDHAGQRLGPAVRPGHHRACRAAGAPHLGMARTYQIITLFPRDTILRNVTLALLGLSKERWNPLTVIDRRQRPGRARPRGAGAGRPRPHRRPAAVADLLRRAPAGRDRHGAGAKPEGAAARRALRRPVDRRAARRAGDCCAPFRAT